MQADRLDAALGEMTTAKQMDSKLVAADYNLGILYKRESRYPDAETALKRVTEADPREPAAWLNLGVVYFSKGKLQDALSAYQHVLDMGFGRAQNFYVAALFRTSTALFRLKKTAEAQKYLAQHAKMKDSVRAFLSRPRHWRAGNTAPSWFRPCLPHRPQTPPSRRASGLRTSLRGSGFHCRPSNFRPLIPLTSWLPNSAMPL